MTSLKEIAIQMRAAVKGYVAKALAPVVDDLSSLRVRLESLPVPVDGKDGEPGPPGPAGKDADQKALSALIVEQVGHEIDSAMSSMPKAQDGRDGKDADPAMVAQLIAASVATAVSAIPVPLPGEPGERGADGRAGTDGREGVDGEKGEKGESGKDGADGIDGLPGEIGKDAADIEVLSEINEAKVYAKGTFACYKGGMIHAARKTSPITEGLEAAGWRVCMNGIAEELEEVGAKGAIKRTTVYTSGAAVVTEIKNGAVSYRGGLKDGKPIDLAGLVESRMTTWEADFARRAQLAIDRMPSPRDGVDGTDGQPGGSIEDFAIEVKDRTLAVGMKIGGKDVVQTIKLDMPIYRGVYQSGKRSEKGDIVTFAGSAFIALRDTDDKPESSKDFQLFVKRGRDGKDGKDSPVPEAIES